MPRAVLTLRRQDRNPTRTIPLASDRRVLVAVQGERGRAALDGVTGRLDVALPHALSHVGTIADLEHVPLDGVGALLDLRALDAPSDARGALASAKVSLFLAQRARPALLQGARAGGAFYLVVTALEGESHPVTGAVHGLLKTAALEWPEVACAVLDVHPDVDVADAIADELTSGFMDVEAVRTPEARRVPAVLEEPVGRTDTSRLGGGVWVASGGARGVTGTTLLALARSTRPSLLLIGRTPLAAEPPCCMGAGDEATLKRALIEDAKANGRPLQLGAIGEEAKRVLAVREITGFLAHLEAAGARVMYRAADVRDVDAVASACAEARAAFGPITGLVHGAGVLADKRIEDKTADQVDRVMDTKVLGLEALLEATRDDPLQTVALFSSVAGRFGNVGQVDYAMANEALNEVAQRLRRQRPDCVVKSLNWGPWEGGMVTPALKRVFEERGVRVLSHADGARHFVDELGAGDAHVEVLFGGELGGSELGGGAHAVPPPHRADAAPTAFAMGSTHARRFHIDARGWPFLADHAVRGVAVLPVVGALELFARASGARVLAEVRVLRGIKLPDLEGAGHTLEVERAGDLLSLRVAGERVPSYTARVEPPIAPRSIVRPSGLSAWSLGAPYPRLLFHGPRFHLIDVVDAVGRDGLAARVRGSLGRGWGDELAADMGALDAALQAALLWARHLTGGAFLPTGVGRVHLVEPVPGALQCLLVGRSLDAARAVCDVALSDMSGRTVALLEGIEVHRLGDDAAFGASAAARTGGVRA